MYFGKKGAAPTGGPGHIERSPSFAAGLLTGYGDGGLHGDPAREDARLVLAVGDAEGRMHIFAGRGRPHVIAEEVAAGDRRVEHVEGLVGQPLLVAPVRAP